MRPDFGVPFWATNRKINLWGVFQAPSKVIISMSKPPLGIGVKRNDLRPWRALAPTRLSWRDPSCGNRWLPGATPPAAPPRPTTTTALLTWARRRLQLRPPVCAQTSPKRLPDVTQTFPRRLPDVSQTTSKPLPAVSQPSPSRLPDLSQPSPRRLPEEGGGTRRLQMASKINLKSM